ncbi:MAG: DUF433 domain-containing protein [Rhodoglobus sp.]|nr:DUF433 domain-containing protein [Rhodoglobus sp.]
MNQRAPEEIGRIVQTPGVLGGRPRLDGTRIGTSNVWGHEAGASIEEILESMAPHMYGVPTLKFACA